MGRQTLAVLTVDRTLSFPSVHTVLDLTVVYRFLTDHLEELEGGKGLISRNVLIGPGKARQDLGRGGEKGRK